jgi:hypothetical protein
VTDVPEAEPDMEMARMTGDWVPCLPKAYEKSVVLGGGRVLYPCPDPEAQAAILTEHVKEIARRAFQAGRRAGKAEIREAIFD